MWIIFGWEKEEKPLGPILSHYCYDCRRKTEWHVWNEAEWVTFSDIRTIKFANKHRLHCESCVFILPLRPSEFRKVNRHMKRNDSVDGTSIAKRITARIDIAQLGSKTPQQIKYIRESMLALKEYEETIRQQNERSA